MAVSTFPELADLVAADLYACTNLWRAPSLCTTVLRMAYTLGPTGHGTLAAFLRAPRVPCVLGFDPLFQFMHEEDVVSAICLSLDKRIRGVYNVAGPQPVPLSVIARAAGRKPIPLPAFIFERVMGRFGLPRLPRAALTHIKYPVVVDSSSFRAATGFKHDIDEARAIREYSEAHPIRSS